MDHKEFDDIVGKKLGAEQTFSFDENQWKDIEAQLDGKRKKRALLWWYWGAAAALLLLVGFAWNHISLTNKVQELQSQVNQIQLEDSRLKKEISSKNTVEEKATENADELVNIKQQNIKLDTPQTNDSPKGLPVFSTQKPSPQNTQTNKNPALKPIAESNPLEVVEVNESKLIISKDEVINLKGDDISNVVASTSGNVSNGQNDESSLTKDDLVDTESPRKTLDEIEKLSNKWDGIEVSNTEEAQFALSKQRIKRPFKFKSFATGLSANRGWGLTNAGRNSTFGRLNSADGFDFSRTNTVPYQQNVTSQTTSNFRWWNQVQFTKGWSIRTEVGRKVIDYSISNIASIQPEGFGFNPDAPFVFNGANVFATADVIGETEAASINQKEWTLSAGLSYSFFRKWKVQPVMSVFPEFAWNNFRDENFLSNDPNAINDDSLAYYSRSFSINKWHLRNISTRLGVQGLIKNHIYWNVEYGYNIPLYIVSPALLNQHQIGASVGYSF